MLSRNRLTDHYDHPTVASAIPLESLIVNEDHRRQGIRLLIRDLVNNPLLDPAQNKRCRQKTFRATGFASQFSEELAVIQTPTDIKFTVQIPGQSYDETVDGNDGTRYTQFCRPPVLFDLYYDPASDDQILFNKSDVSITASRVSSTGYHNILSMGVKGLWPGTWIIEVRGTPVMELRIIKRQRCVVQSHSIYKPSALLASQPLLHMREGDVVSMPGENDGELYTYQLTKQTQIAETSLSSVFTAQHSDLPDGVSTIVKVLKTRRAGTTSHNLSRDGDRERNVIRQADMWLREYQAQALLSHDSVAALYGGDARLLTLYMEYVDGHDLTAKASWRCDSTDAFLGSRVDAHRVLRDTAAALRHMHARRVVHNDIKPANILYSRARGAVLCDLGLATMSLTASAGGGGTPYYIPPEFIGAKKLRGPAADIWALGVTMLYLLGKTPFPDARSRRNRPDRLYWVIADVNKRATSTMAGGEKPAVVQMREWLAEVEGAKSRLDPANRLERLVLDMLEEDPRQRITAAMLCAELSRWE